ncbi:occludin/ELL domain-containing protein 1 isoform 4-T4 [Rhynchonycteris naso]
MCALLPCPQAAHRPPPPRAGHDGPRRTRLSAPVRPSGSFPRSMPTRAPTHTHGSRVDLQTRPPGLGPPHPGVKTSVLQPLCQPQPGDHRARPKKIVFEDELPYQTFLGTKKPVGYIPRGHMPRPQPVPDYELKYPSVSSERERSCCVAVFQDQYAEFLELQQELSSAQAKLQQLEALLTSLPLPRSQKEAQVATRVWREFEKKRMKKN